VLAAASNAATVAVPSDAAMAADAAAYDVTPLFDGAALDRI
jgi:hypothetical protein